MLFLPPFAYSMSILQNTASPKQPLTHELHYNHTKESILMIAPKIGL